MRKKQNRILEFPSLPQAIEWTNVEEVSKKIEEIQKQYTKTIIEVGCGRGEYTVGLAQNNHSCLYFGLDYQGERLWQGVQKALTNNIHNAYFIRSYAYDIPNIFLPNSIDEVWVTYPDPQPKKPRKRIFSSYFLQKYITVLKPGGLIHIKTDNDDIYRQAKQDLISLQNTILIDCNPITEGDAIQYPYLQIMTRYEKKFGDLGSTQKYLCAQIYKE